MRRQHKRDRACSQLNIGCGHDTAEHVDLEQQLVKNREARPEQYVVRTSAKYLSAH